MILSQAVKILTSKYLYKHTFSLRNALGLQKVYQKPRKPGPTAKIFTPKYSNYAVCNTEHSALYHVQNVLL